MTVIGMIGTMRAASNVDPSSPTTAAIMANETRISDRERMARVDALNMQAAEYEAEATQRRELAQSTRKIGKISAASKFLSGVSSLGSLASRPGRRER